MALMGGGGGIVPGPDRPSLAQYLARFLTVAVWFWLVGGFSFLFGFAYFMYSITGGGSEGYVHPLPPFLIMLNGAIGIAAGILFLLKKRWFFAAALVFVIGVILSLRYCT